MEDALELLFVLIVLGASLVAKALKSEKKRVADAARQGASPAKQPTAKPSQATVMPPMSFSDIPGQVITPTVHPHVQPDCDTHDKPGSLGITSTEGKDPCHAEQLSHRRTVDEPIEEAGSLTLEWSGENMVKAFVMQEVLTRPCQRARH